MAREVGTEGKLGGQAQVAGVAGTWKDLTDNVNSMADEPHRPGAQHRGGHDRGRERRPVEEDHRGRAGRDSGAEEHDQHDGRPAPLLRRRGDPRRPGGRNGRKARRAGDVTGVGGTWKDLTDCVNSMAGNLDRPGAKHRRCNHRSGQRRPYEEDHRGRERRKPSS